MTNKQKAKRLEEIAACPLCMESADGKLLREAAAMMREWGESEVQWDAVGGAAKNGLYLWAGPCVNGFASLVQRGRRRLYLDWHPTLEAAQAAAIAWADQQEGKDV
jgi:hypothetical protein